jgi:hypothetical protein
VHPDESEAAFLVDARELALPIGAKTLVSAPGADASFEHGVQRALNAMKVSRNNPFRRQLVRARTGSADRSGSKDETGSGEQFE